MFKCGFVGVVGKPNAGKSTFISQVSNARPRIADYPFTTLHPNLGVVRSSAAHSFVIADLPGLISGASEGAGLGHLFLRHLSRTRLLLHIVDVSHLDPEVNAIEQAIEDIETITEELRLYNPALYEKPRWLALNKIDMLEDPEGFKTELCTRINWKGPVFEMSALTGQGTQTLVLKIQSWLDQQQAEEQRLADEAQAGFEPDDPRFKPNRQNIDQAE